jgi:hypothetical protein
LVSWDPWPSERIMSKAERIVGVALVGLAGALFVACGGGEGDPYSPPVPSLVDHVEVNPTLDTLTALGATRRYSAAAKSSSGSTVGGVSFNWSSTATGVATVDSDGLVTAVGRGTATIRATATDAGVTGSGTAVVIQVPVSMDVSPTPVGLAIGETVQLGATAEDSRGNSISNPQVSWTSSNQSIARVNSNGLVTALGVGQATITAESVTASANAEITVLVAELVTVRNIVTDAFVDHLIDYLETTTAANLKIAVIDMRNALGEGDQAKLEAALTTAQGIVDSGTQDDAVLLAYLDLVFDHIQAILDQL